MNDHKKKKIAPIIITVLVILYYLVYFGFIIAVIPSGLKLVFGIIPAALATLMIIVCLERLHEIDGGEDDDLSKY